MTVGFRDIKATLPYKAVVLAVFLASCTSPLPPEPCHWTYNRFQWTQIDSAGIYWRNYVTDSTLICP